MQSKLTKQQLEQANELLHLFKVDGQPADEVATPGEVEIFGLLIFEVSTRLHIMVSTQYGKSLFVALACIVLSCLDDELITIAAPTDEKASIIMRYYIQHIGDNILFSEKLDKTTKLERLQTETTKDRIILRKNPKTGKAGGIFVISIQGGNSKKGFEAAMGEGCRIVIGDESCLIPDTHEATMFRMIAGKKNGIYVKIGNPFYKLPPNSHFFKSYRDPRYTKVDINYHQAIDEGRYSRDFIEEAKGKPLFSVLYENKFPETKTQDDTGYIQLITEATLDNAYLPTDIELDLMGEKFMGVDIAGGGRNKSAITVRGSNVAKLVFHKGTADPMILVSEMERVAKLYDIKLDDEHVFPDKTGAIAFCARMNEVWPYKADGSPNSFGITAGETPEVDEDVSELIIKTDKQGNQTSQSVYLNRRAQMSFRTAKWLQQGGKLVGKPEYDESLHIRYKVQSDKKLKIKSKEEMQDDGIESPDCWDSLCLTFGKRSKVVAPRKRYKQRDVEPMTEFGI